MASLDDLFDVLIFGMKDVILGVIVILILLFVMEMMYVFMLLLIEIFLSINVDFLCIDRFRSFLRFLVRFIIVVLIVEFIEIDFSGVFLLGLNLLM